MESNKKITLTDAKGNLIFGLESVRIDSEPIKSTEGIGLKVIGVAFLALIAMSIGYSIKDAMTMHKIVKELGSDKINELRRLFGLSLKDSCTAVEYVRKNAKNIVRQLNQMGIGKFEVDSDIETDLEIEKMINELIDPNPEQDKISPATEKYVKNIIRNYIAKEKRIYKTDEVTLDNVVLASYEIPSFDKLAKISEKDGIDCNWDKLQEIANKEETTIVNTLKNKFKLPSVKYVDASFEVDPNPDDYVGYGNLIFKTVVSPRNKALETALNQVILVIKNNIKRK
jgi:hypothetical protein